MLCYSINTIYVIIFILLSILFIGSALILYYWIGIGSDDIPFYNDVVGYFNQTNTTHTAGFVPIRPIFPQTYVAEASFMETQSYERLTTLGHRLGKVADRLTTPSTPSKLLNVLFNTTVNRGVNVINSNSVFVQYHQ